MGNDVDTSGWHPVSAITYTDVNKAIAANSSKPSRFTIAAPDNSVSADAPFGQSNAPATLQISSCAFPIMLSAAYLPHTSSSSQFDLVPSQSTPATLSSYDPNDGKPTTNFLANAALQDLLQLRLTANIGEFNALFATVDLDGDYINQGVSWLKPSYKGYAVVEPTQGPTSNRFKAPVSPEAYPMTSFRALLGSLAVLLLLAPLSQAQTESAAPTTAAQISAAEPAMQLPADQTAYSASKKIIDAGQHKKALEAFLRDFPQSKRADAARQDLLTLLLKQPPQDVKQIHALAQTLIDHSPPDERFYAEYRAASEFAEALPHGVDLQSAAKWAEDAVNRSTLDSLTALIKKSAAQFDIPIPSEQEVHEQWANLQANLLQGLGEVYLRQRKYTKATEVLDRAVALDPAVGAIYGTRAEVEHAGHQDAQASADLVLASVYGGITPDQDTLLKQLYPAQHPDNPSGLEAEIDRRYETLPKPFTPTPHTGAPGKQTVLVELYTGSECDPCVAADYAVDGILEAYPRSEVVALAFDMHNPEPDPLANPDTAARAGYNGIVSTPSLRVNGRPVSFAGGPRSKAKESFETFEKAVDSQAQTSSGLSVQLTAKLEGTHTVVTTAEVHVSDPDALQTLLATPIEPDKQNILSAKLKDITPGKTPTEQASRLVLNFALVQQTVRYSGSNGVRFHRMVVRALAKPTAEAFPVALTGSSTASSTFDTTAISQSLGSYLTAYEQHNEKFGTAHFLMKDTTLPPDQLAVAAWVEDPKTHHVVAAAFVPLKPQTQEAAR